MGQSYKIINLDKQEYLSPYTFNDGAKLMEFSCSRAGVLTALALLLADGNGRGGGDLHSANPVIGSWAGDQIVIAGDYADDEKFLGKEQLVKYKMLQENENANLYSYAGEYFNDISEKALEAMLDDEFVFDIYKEANLRSQTKSVFERVVQKKKQQNLLKAEAG